MCQRCDRNNAHKTCVLIPDLCHLCKIHKKFILHCAKSSLILPHIYVWLFCAHHALCLISSSICVDTYTCHMHQKLPLQFFISLHLLFFFLVPFFFFFYNTITANATRNQFTNYWKSSKLEAIQSIVYAIKHKKKLELDAILKCHGSSQWKTFKTFSLPCNCRVAVLFLFSPSHFIKRENKVLWRLLSHCTTTKFSVWCKKKERGNNF